MKTPLLAVAVILSATSLAAAAPGDPVALRGTLSWPPSLGAEPFAVVRGDDGRVMYADLSGAERRGKIAAGDRISLLGVEGAKPHEVTAVAIGPGDSVLASLPSLRQETPSSGAPAAPVAPEPARPATPAADNRPTERLEGTLEAVGDGTVTLKTDAGRTVKVDVSKLGKSVLGGVKAGDRVTVFAVTEADKTLTAIGFIHSTRRSAAPR